MVQLVVARGVQGLGGGLLITASYVLIGETYPSHLQPKVFIATSGAWLVPSLVGPLVSGTLTQHASWRWVFLGLLPFVLIGSALMVPVLRSLHRPSTAPGRARRSAPGAARPRRRARCGRVRGRRPAPVRRRRRARRRRHRRGRLGAARAAATGHAARASGRRFGRRAARAVRRRVLRRRRRHPARCCSSSTVSGATAAGLPLAVTGLTWAFGSWWQGRDVPGDDEHRRVRLAVRRILAARHGHRAHRDHQPAGRAELAGVPGLGDRRRRRRVWP